MDKAAVLDQDYLRVNYHQAGFSYLLPEILALFRRQAAIYLQSIEQHLMQANLHELALEAHTLKGAAGSVGAAALAQIAQHLEETVPDSDIAAVTLLVDSLREITDRTDAAITAELARLAAETDDTLDHI
ncbi:Hpt domain-containing protein [Trichlorobacter lovleyi]|uniref:Putative CheA signal transduction histidine kinase n=1 Tax=Trichlorobacter lovleyi (strain ATCC BAA-1151 / DSM 17278 / SZ) TaxID=398767 RepID=B3E6G5_TRIL1|nr:Hpt domain-containing protein [Trichlorobacter lovleyi]ACD96312.1 putative CheA signal transduction histidine kinase [Trichlorobacter lovleyi SZ]